MFGPGRTCDSSRPSMNTSASIQPRAMTCWRILAFWPPPNEVDEIAANASAILRSGGRVAGGGDPAGSADIRQRAVDNRRAMLARKNVDVHVLGVLVGRQHAHTN